MKEKSECEVCGSRRQRNLRSKVLKAKIDAKWRLVEVVRCLRCWDIYEPLGDGKNRAHPEGSKRPTGKPAYRYYDRAQAERVNPDVERR